MLLYGLVDIFQCIYFLKSFFGRCMDTNESKFTDIYNIKIYKLIILIHVLFLMSDDFYGRMDVLFDTHYIFNLWWFLWSYGCISELLISSKAAEEELHIHHRDLIHGFLRKVINFYDIQ